VKPSECLDEFARFMKGGARRGLTKAEGTWHCRVAQLAASKRIDFSYGHVTPEGASIPLLRQLAFQ
jgi:hypothetical protein